MITIRFILMSNSEILNHPKVAWLVMLLVQVSEWYVDWASPLIIAITSLFSCLTVIMLYRVHRLNAIKLKIEIENLNKQG